MCHTAHLGLGLIAVLVLLYGSRPLSKAQEPPQLPPPLPLAQFLALAEDPQQDAWRQPDAVLEVLSLQKGQQVAEIGAWSGYFTLRLAQAVGPTGHVTAFEYGEEILAYLRQRVTREGVTNVTAKRLVLSEIPLDSASFDLIFINNFYHHLHHQTERKGYLKRIHAALKPAGRIVILDFMKKAHLPVGPAPHMRLSLEEVEKELQAAQFSLTQTLTFLPYQYIMIAERKALPTGER